VIVLRVPRPRCFLPPPPPSAPAAVQGCNRSLFGIPQHFAPYLHGNFLGGRLSYRLSWAPGIIMGQWRTVLFVALPVRAPFFHSDCFLLFKSSFFSRSQTARLVHFSNMLFFSGSPLMFFSPSLPAISSLSVVVVEIFSSLPFFLAIQEPFFFFRFLCDGHGAASPEFTFVIFFSLNPPLWPPVPKVAHERFEFFFSKDTCERASFFFYRAPAPFFFFFCFFFFFFFFGVFFFFFFFAFSPLLR